MIEIFVTTMATLAIVLYLQARHCARVIRRNRDNAQGGHRSLLVHPTEQ